MEEKQYNIAPMAEPEEEEIDLLNLCLRILQQWRGIIVAMIIGALVANAFGVFSRWKEIKEIEAYISPSEETISSLVKEQEEIISELAMTLTEEELKKVDAAIDSREVYEQRKEVGMEYYDKSILMDVDYQHVPTRTVYYSIDVPYEVEYPVISTKDYTNNIMAAYPQFMTEEKVYTAIAEGMGWDLETRYIKELISVYTTNTMLYITAIADTQENCDKLLELMMAQVEPATEKIQALYGDYSIELLSDNTYETVRQDILTTQQNKAIDEANYDKNIASLGSDLSDDEKSYYDAINTKNDLLNGRVKSYAAERIVMPEMDYLRMKYALIGAVLGAFLVAAYVMCRYVISGTLHNAEDMKNSYQVDLLGSVMAQQPKHRFGRIDAWLLRLFHYAQSEEENANEMRMIEARAGITMKREALKNVYLTGSSGDAQSAEIMAQVQNALCGVAQTVASGSSPLTDAESLHAMVAADGVILVERVECSKTADILREVAMCRENNVRIIGAVVVR